MVADVQRPCKVPTTCLRLNVPLAFAEAQASSSPNGGIGAGELPLEDLAAFNSVANSRSVVPRSVKIISRDRRA